MYLVNDKRGAIRSIQGALGFPKSGIYDKKTKERVKSIQEGLGLPVTGFIDYDTFILIKETERKDNIRREVKALLPHLGRFPYKENDMGEDVRYINGILSEAIGKLNLQINKPRGAYFGIYTIEAVRYLNRITLNENKDFLDEALIYRLLRLRMRN